MIGPLLDSKSRLGPSLLVNGASLLAIAYATGWLFKSIGILKFGVGPISVGREASLALGITVGILLGLVYIIHLSVRKAEDWMRRAQCHPLALTICAAVGMIAGIGLVLWLWTGVLQLVQPDKPDITSSVFWWFLAFLVVPTFFLRVAGGTLETLVRFAVVAVALCGSVPLFARFIYVLMPAYTGGPLLHQVHMTLKEPSEEIDGTLLEMDSDAVIYATSARAAPVRVPVARIVEIRAQPPSERQAEGARGE